MFYVGKLDNLKEMDKFLENTVSLYIVSGTVK